MLRPHVQKAALRGFLLFIVSFVYLQIIVSYFRFFE